MPAFTATKYLLSAAMLLATIPLLGCQTLLLGRVSDSAEAGDEQTTSGDSTSDGESVGTVTECTDSGCGLCTPNDHLDCHNGDVFWFDSCSEVGEFVQACGTEGCAAGACILPSVPCYVALGNICETYTEADGAGPGGGETMEICANVDYWSGHMQIRVRKHAGAMDPVFDDRRYDVRVSDAPEDCGPDTFYFDVADNAPVGVGTGELAFNFPATWLDTQKQKAYCVTAAMKPEDNGYLPLEPGKQSWWWSDKITVVRECE